MGMAPLGAARTHPGCPILLPSGRGPQGGLLVSRRRQDTSCWLAGSFWTPHPSSLPYFCLEEGVGRLERGLASQWG